MIELRQIRGVTILINISERINDSIPFDIRELLQSGNYSDSQIRYINKMPWAAPDTPEIDVNFAKDTLEKSHYGMNDIKSQILRYIVCQKHLGHSYGDVLLLVGPPGVGKTSIAKSVASAMKREFVKISLAGMSDAGPLRGYDTNYQSPKPGHIIDAIIKTNSFCPLILLDEIDKLGKDSSNGNPAYVLLDILDSDRTQFIDAMIDIPIDLSNIVFIATANSLRDISPILLNRFNVIKLGAYTREEKIVIATNYLIPSLISEYKVETYDLEFTKELIEHIVDNHAHEPGIRSLKRQLVLLIESIITAIYLGQSISHKINIATYNQLLGITIPNTDKKSKKKKVTSKPVKYNY